MKRKPRRHGKTAPVTARFLSARELAFLVLDEYKQTGRFVTQLLDAQLAAHRVSDEDRRLAMQLIHGIVRRQATLDALVQAHVQRPRHKIEGALWTLMQLGAYQLVFLSSVPAHAALNETVELTKWLRKPRWSGFLNGVLRAVTRSLADEFIDEPAADAVPIEAGRYRRVQRAIFPEPTGDPVEYLSKAFSFPRWLIRRWSERWPFAELVRLGFWFNTPAKLCLRVNQLRTDRDTYLKALAAAGIDAHPGDFSDSIWLDSSTRVERLPGFAEGQFTVQDETAMRAAALLAPQPGETVLDLCAAPGSKTTHLAELMRDQGRILGTDVQPERLRLVEDSARRLGLTIIETLPISPEGGNIPAGPFDAAVVDVPCSNTGVLAKRPEARWRIRPRDIQELAALQQRLLDDAINRLKPTGRVVYSTCSIEPEENQNVVQALLAKRDDLELIEDREHLPGRPADGGYQALLRRKPTS